MACLKVFLIQHLPEVAFSPQAIMLTWCSLELHEHTIFQEFCFVTDTNAKPFLSWLIFNTLQLLILYSRATVLSYFIIVFLTMNWTITSWAICVNIVPIHVPESKVSANPQILKRHSWVWKSIWKHKPNILVLT